MFVVMFDTTDPILSKTKVGIGDTDPILGVVCVENKIPGKLLL